MKMRHERNRRQGKHKRKELLHNIHDVNKYFAMRSGNFKLLHGSFRGGKFDEGSDSWRITITCWYCIINISDKQRRESKDQEEA